jgi:hypothetical protein
MVNNSTEGLPHGFHHSDTTSFSLSLDRSDYINLLPTKKLVPVAFLTAARFLAAKSTEMVSGIDVPKAMGMPSQLTKQATRTAREPAQLYLH